MRKPVFLAILCAGLCAALVSCGGDTPAESTTDMTVTTTPEATEDMPDLPDASTLSLEGDFCFLVSGNWAWNDFASDGTDGTAVDNAIYRRNRYLADNYGVNITNKDIVAFSSAMGSGKGFTELYMNYMSGNNVYDAAMIGTYDAANLAYSGVLQDLNETPYINLQKDYWDQRANADLSVSGRMYYSTGDISLSDNRSTHALIFNKEMIKMYGMDDPYELVRNNEWTLDKFASMVKMVGDDLNNDGVYNKEDRMGLLSAVDNNLAILAAAGEKIATLNDKGEIELTLYSERVVNLYDDYLALIEDHTHVFNWQMNYQDGTYGNVATTAELADMLNSNRALFYFHMLFIMDELRDLETDFGILPYPKYEATQADYGHLVSAWHSEFLCIPQNVNSLERSGYVTELLAYQGKKLMTPAYYEKTLVGQYTRDEESAEMLDLIFATRTYDVGYYYALGTYKDLIGKMPINHMSLTTIYDTYYNTAVSKMDAINKMFSQNK